MRVLARTRKPVPHRPIVRVQADSWLANRKRVMILRGDLVDRMPFVGHF